MGFYATQGRFAEAEPLLKRALEIIEKTTPIGNPEVAPILQFLAVLYVAQGRFAEAEPLAKRSIEIFERALPAGHPNIATALGSLALLYQRQGRLTEAEALFRRALEMRKNAQPPDPLATATSLGGLAGPYQGPARREAERRRSGQQKSKRRPLPEGHPRLGLSTLAPGAAAYRRKDAWRRQSPSRAGLAEFEGRCRPLIEHRLHPQRTGRPQLRKRRMGGRNQLFAPCQHNHHREEQAGLAIRRRRGDRYCSVRAFAEHRSVRVAHALSVAARRAATGSARRLERGGIHDRAMGGQTSAGAALAQMAVRFRKG